ncbi:hypothetical protein [Actinokineospora sp. HUAS TT18]|uniref:hypothetical protein n=1 Tax=Actinokineospora sp. HUAS TT18 TaxID=3447451 RepID=UPI003F52772E
MSRLLGISIALTGAAHFVAPQVFEPVSRLAFPEDTGQWIKRNGATEVAIGLALAGGRTRKAGVVGLAAYGAWLGSRVLKNR